MRLAHRSHPGDRDPETPVITGVRTDACVERSARHAAERGFQVIVVDDAGAAWEEGSTRPTAMADGGTR